MKIGKVINNNVVSTFDANGQEVILVGTGIGFRGKEGKKIDETKIQKVFRPEDPRMTSRLKELLMDLPMEQLEVSTEIIEHAKRTLDTELNENIYITLTDHIHFAVQRYQEHMMFPNPMLREVKLFYDKEFQLGEYALETIQQRLGIQLPIDEAVSVALHIVSAEFDTRVKDTLKITGFMEEVIEIITDYFKIKPDENSLNYERFITHLKFLSRKLFSAADLDDINDDMEEMIQKLCPKEYACAQKVAQYIMRRYERQMTPGEVAYLTMHIERMCKNSKQKKEKEDV